MHLTPDTKASPLKKSPTADTQTFWTKNSQKWMIKWMIVIQLPLL